MFFFFFKIFMSEFFNILKMSDSIDIDLSKDKKKDKKSKGMGI